MSDRILRRWLGVTLTLIGVVAILWLAATGRLEFYIHPRYTVFTVVMAVIGGAIALGAFILVSTADEHDDHGHDAPRPRWRSAAAVGGSVALIAAATVALLVLPPATLSAATAESRDIAATTPLTAIPDAGESVELASGDSTSFTVKDWATLLRQGLGDDFFAGKPAAFSGFLVASEDSDVVYVARFLVTCCAVDALPLGVPVLIPGWQDEHAVDDWVQVEGAFATNPDAGSASPIVLVPSEITPIDQPAQPYVY